MTAASPLRSRRVHDLKTLVQSQHRVLHMVSYLSAQMKLGPSPSQEILGPSLQSCQAWFRTLLLGGSSTRKPSRPGFPRVLATARARVSLSRADVAGPEQREARERLCNDTPFLVQPCPTAFCSLPGRWAVARTPGWLDCRVSFPLHFSATGDDAGEIRSGAQSLTFTEGRADPSGPSGTELVGSNFALTS